jgi:type II secretory pathway component PulF
MAKYSYTAISEPQKTAQGAIEAESEQEAINKLAGSGYFVTSIQAENASVATASRNIVGFHRVSRKDLLSLTRQLSGLIGSGVNILTSLNIAYTQTDNKQIKVVLFDIIAQIKDGKSISESLSCYPHIFPNLYTSIIHSAEAGGTLDEALKRLEGFLEKEEEFRDSIRQALTYPVFVFAVGTLTVAFMMVFVIPRLVGIFETMGQVLPLPTRILISISAFARGYWWLVTAVILAAVFLLRRLNRRQEFRVWLDRLKLKLAIWGKVILKTEISRVARTLSLSLTSGIPVISALDISTAVAENHTLKTELQKFKEQINGGLSFSHCLKESKLFPPSVANIVTVGEESGKLETALLSVASDYDRELDRLLKTLPRLLEPVVIVAMGLVVGFIVVSMLLPVFQINLMVK